MTIVDLSTYQGAVSVAAFTAMRLQGGVNRVIHKAGGSNAGTYIDSQYVANVARARQAGMKLGHYWFNGDGAVEADAAYFVRRLASYEDGDWLIIDVENEYDKNGNLVIAHWTPAKVLAWAHAMRAMKPTAILKVYMSSSVTHEADWSAVVAFGVGLWVAQYSNSTPSVSYWKGWDAWQYTSSGTLPGISGRVDLSHESAQSALASTGTTSPLLVAHLKRDNMTIPFLFHEVTTKGDQAYLALGPKKKFLVNDRNKRAAMAKLVNAAGGQDGKTLSLDGKGWPVFNEYDVNVIDEYLASQA